ncbi:MAG: hypothetical protein J6C16_03485, partial [Clostridia bacterium]|nr:hypothetical protein [Clostridia bacterium]
MGRKLFTSESVTEGHPDKICDLISDSVLDAIYKEDPKARVACETFVTTGTIVVMGEITTDCYVDIPKIARDTVNEIGYNRAKFGFDASTCGVLTQIDEQSADIALGVDKAKEAKEGEKEDKTCCSLNDVEDARAVAFRLGMPFYVFNFSADFNHAVIDR